TIVHQTKTGVIAEPQGHPADTEMPLHQAESTALRWTWRFFALLAGLLDPVAGLLAGIPGWAMGVGATHRFDTPRRRRRGLILVFGGIEGPSVHQRRMALGLVHGGWR